MISISSPSVITLQDGINLINSNNKPIVFFDACSLLDILRIPLPQRKNDLPLKEDLVWINQFISSDKVMCFSSFLCIKEFDDHAQEAIDSYARELKTIQEPVNKYIAFLNSSGILSAPLVSLDLDSYHLENFFLDICRNILGKIKFIKVEDAMNTVAIRKVVEKEPPAHKKEEYKDCVIWETFLKLIQGRTDHSKPNFFLSSNKQDYCVSVKSSDLHPDLKSEANGFNAVFAFNYQVLRGRFTLHGIS